MFDFGHHVKYSYAYFFYKDYEKLNSQIAKKLRNSSSRKIEFKKLFILTKEILNILLLYFHLFPVSYYLEGT